MSVQNQRVNGIVFNAKITVTQTGFLKLRNSRIFSPCQSQVLFKGHLMVRTADLEELDSSNVGRLQDRQMRSSFSNNRWSHLVVPVECVILVPTTWLFAVPTGTIIYYLVRTITWRGGPRSPRINTSLHKECFLLSPGSSWCSWSLHVFVKCPLGFASFIFLSDGNWEEILVACENVFASQDYEIVRIGGFMRLDSLTRKHWPPWRSVGYALLARVPGHPGTTGCPPNPFHKYCSAETHWKSKLHGTGHR